MQILTKNNAKIEKGEKLGYKTFGIHLAPSTLSGKNTCPHASKGCAAACLNTAGFGVYNHVQQARIKKTQAFFQDRQAFLNQLLKEVEAKVKSAKKAGMIPTFRLNLTSDLKWESFKVKDGKNIMELFPEVQWYDYTKDFKRMIDYTQKKLPKNYHLTFSRSESNEEQCKIVLGMGGNVAVVFRGGLPKTYLGKKVINADNDDLRFLDKKNVIVGLIQKGKAKKDSSGFVVEVK